MKSRTDRPANTESRAAAHQRQRPAAHESGQHAPAASSVQRFQRMADQFAEKRGATVQRVITIPTEPRSPMSWGEAYLAHVYPRRREIMENTGASESAILDALQRYDRGGVSFSSIEKMLEILRQELVIERLERTRAGIEEGSDDDGSTHSQGFDEDDASSSSGEEPYESKEPIESKEAEPEPRDPVDVLEDTVIFGARHEVIDRGAHFVLYRSIEDGELAKLKETIGKTGLPLFTFKEGKKGKAEKMFAPNKAYVVESMGEKGKRANLLEIIVDRKAIDALIYNPKYATYQNDENDFVGRMDLKRGSPSKPSSITLKRESPKKKKSLSYTSINIGFRLHDNSLGELAKYIVAINLIEKKYNVKEVTDTLRYIA